MSLGAGPWYVDDLLTFYQTAHDPATGGAVDADSPPTYRVYEHETGTAILTGSMALLDTGSTVGLYSEQLTLSAANGFEVGKSYCVYREVVVGGVTDTAEDSFKIIAAVAAGATPPTAIEIADALLTRDWTAVSGPAARSLLQAARFLRNKWSITGTTLTVTEEDDTTTAWTATLTASTGAAPVTGVDPA